MIPLSARTRTLNLLRSLFIHSRLDFLLPALTNGRKPGHPLVKLLPNNYQYPRNTLRTAFRSGIHYELDLNQFMEWFLYFGVAVEPREGLLELLRDGDTVVDVGANIGELALKFSKAVGSKGRVISFEPNPVSRRKCERNLSLNNATNITLVPFGLGDVSGEFSMETVCETNFGGSRISELVDKKNADGVKVTTLDQYLSENPLDKVALIKLDVEGFETKVLAGAAETLKKFKPMLFVEISAAHLSDQGSSPETLLRLLEDHGYACAEAHSGKPVSSSNPPKNQCDIICRQN